MTYPSNEYPDAAGYPDGAGTLDEGSAAAPESSETDTDAVAGGDDIVADLGEFLDGDERDEPEL